jgi:RecQ family ATP-dependent DNA helicase
MPALLEGHGPDRKVTFVISPLISLIQDQEMQMNEFVPNSAIALMSSVSVTECSARMHQVHDPTAGVCLVFITPERMEKSTKLLGDLERLFQANRLGRFVIDEAHCASSWGHDFRPDYAKLGKLKSHFPTVPILAVTATASDSVRHDVCTILRMPTYSFFRSTAARPNLTYSVQHKPKNFEDIAEWIRGQNGGAGIVYTLSKKDADTVAQQLYEAGITAEAYHAGVTGPKRERIHRSWMRNETQVVVATIAFGLGYGLFDFAMIFLTCGR